MQKLFENWRRYQNKIKEAAAPRPRSRSGPRRRDPGVKISGEHGQLKLKLLTMAETAREYFIKTLILDRRKELERKISIRLSEIHGVETLPMPSKFVDDVVSFLNSTEFHFSTKSREHFGTDADYGGPAHYSSQPDGGNIFRARSANHIVFSEIDTYWAEGHPIWRRTDQRYYRRTVYHELGHALDAAIMLGLRAASGETSYAMDPGFWQARNFGYVFDFIKKTFVGNYTQAPSGDLPAIQILNKKDASRYLSQDQFNKIKSIAKPNLSIQRTGVHKEYVVEFYASLKELIVTLGRDITPLDIQVWRLHAEYHGRRAMQRCRNIEDTKLVRWRTIQDIDGGVEVLRREYRFHRLLTDWIKSIGVHKPRWAHGPAVVLEPWQKPMYMWQEDIDDLNEVDMPEEFYEVWCPLIKSETMRMLRTDLSPAKIASILHEIL